MHVNVLLLSHAVAGSVQSGQPSHGQDSVGKVQPILVPINVSHPEVRGEQVLKDQGVWVVSAALTAAAILVRSYVVNGSPGTLIHVLFGTLDQVGKHHVGITSVPASRNMTFVSYDYLRTECPPYFCII